MGFKFALRCLQNFFVLGDVTRLAGGGSAGGVASGSEDGLGSAARFNAPIGVAVSTSGTVYVAEYGNHLIRMISPTGTVARMAENIVTYSFETVV